MVTEFAKEMMYIGLISWLVLLVTLNLWQE